MLDRPEFELVFRVFFDGPGEHAWYTTASFHQLFVPVGTDGCESLVACGDMMGVGPFLIRIYLAFLFMLSSFGADSVSCACLSSTLHQATERWSFAPRIDSDLLPSQSHRRGDSPNGHLHSLASPDFVRNNRAPCVFSIFPRSGACILRSLPGNSINHALFPSSIAFNHALAVQSSGLSVLSIHSFAISSHSLRSIYCPLLNSNGISRS